MFMVVKNRSIDELSEDKREVAEKLVRVQTAGHIVVATILSKLQIMKKSDYVKKLETEE